MVYVEILMLIDAMHLTKQRVINYAVTALYQTQGTTS